MVHGNAYHDSRFSTDDLIDDLGCLFDTTLSNVMINLACPFHFNIFGAKERQSFRQGNVTFGNKKFGWVLPVSATNCSSTCEPMRRTIKPVPASALSKAMLSTGSTYGT